ncbi:MULTISPECIES: hypothetical protein [Streptomyces]|uniref:hypothetical protein n=1 Tax=Streptomyces TaxID=1883 RepID=UPI001F51BEFE|nr:MULTISPECIES: hypothetical protein [Streptomyces]
MAIGASFETIGSASRTGNVWVLHGASGGTTTSGAVSFSGPTVGIARSGDDPMFGDTMSGS